MANFALSTFRLPSQPSGGQFRLVTGAKPKAAIFWWFDYNDAPLGGIVIAENCYIGFGFAAGSGANEQTFLTTAAKAIRGVQGGTQCWQDTGSCITIVDHSTQLVLAQVAISSFDSDGITFVQKQFSDLPWQIHALIIHGDEVKAKVINVATNNVVGPQDLLGLGITPELLFFLHTDTLNVNGGVIGSHATFSLGVAEFSTLAQQAIFTSAKTILAANTDYHGGSDDAAFCTDVNSGAYTRQLRIVSSGPDGFEVNWIANEGTVRRLLGLAVTGIRQTLRKINVRLDTNEFTVSGLAFKPEVAFFFSPCYGASLGGKWNSTVNRISVGCAKRKLSDLQGGLEQQFCAAHTSSDESGNIVYGNTYIGKQEVWARVKRNASLTLGRMFIKKFTDDGLILKMREGEDTTVETVGANDKFPSDVYALFLASVPVTAIDDPCAVTTLVSSVPSSCPSDQVSKPWGCVNQSDASVSPLSKLVTDKAASLDRPYKPTPASIVFTVAIGNIARGAGVAPIPSFGVEALNSRGTTMVQFTGNITISLGVNPSGAVLGGTLTRTAVDGLATFDDLTIDKDGAGYTLVATA